MSHASSPITCRRVRLLVAAALVIVLSALTPLARAEEAAPSARDLERRAGQAYAEKDYAGAAGALRDALELRPDHPRLLYNLACNYALAGRPDAAFATLDRLAALEVDFGAMDDPDFGALHDDGRWAPLAARFAELAEHVGDAETAFALARWDLIPEGIAHDPETGRFYLGSMREGTILAVETGGEVTRFASVASEGPFACLGLEVDRTRGVLWACGFAYDTVDGFTETDDGRTAVFAFDLATGETRAVHRFPEKHPFGGFNDLTVTSGGDVYIGGAAVYAIPSGTDTPVELDLQGPGAPIASANGVTLSADEGTLYVAAYARGIAAVDLATQRFTWLAHQDTLTLLGIDGLYVHEGSLVAVQNGVWPWRVLRLDLDPSGRVVTGVTTLERANPALAEPTTGALVGDAIFVVGRGPRPARPIAHVPQAIARMLGRTIVLRIPLGGAG